MWQGIKDFFNGVLNFLKNIIDAILGIVGGILNGLWQIFEFLIMVLWDTLKFILELVWGFIKFILQLLWWLIVPREEYFNNLATEFITIIESKFPFFKEVQQAFNPLFIGYYSDVVPTFNFKIWGIDASVIDFTMFEKVRPIVLAISTFIIWFRFIKKLPNKLSKLVGAFG